MSVVDETLDFVEGGELSFDFSDSIHFLCCTLCCPDASELSSVSSIDMVDGDEARSDEL